jgi:hypothetical protein
LTVNPASVELQAGGSGTLVATGYDHTGASVPGVSVTWRSGNESVATVTGGGRVTAVGVGTTMITAATGAVEGTAAILVLPAAPTGQVIQLSPAVRMQRMTGWEGVAQIGQFECNQTAFNKYRDAVVDAAVNDLGINRLRLEIRSGLEHSVDWFAQYASQQISTPEFRSHWYDIVNDNADPFSANPSGFKWSALDHTVDRVVTPFRQRMAARGEQLYVNLTYVDFKATPFEHSTNAEEYAEFMVAAFQHLQSRYGWVPDAVEIILEPDNTGNWRPDRIGAAIVATGDRLAAAGFRPAFIAPSNTSMTSALQYFDDLIEVPRVREYLTDLAYHRYSGVNASVLQQIGTRATTHGIRTGMLEHIGSEYRFLHDDIEIGRASSWEQFAVAFCVTTDNGAQHYMVDESNPANPTFTLGHRSRYLRQYFRHVRLDAVRIGAASGDARFNPLAFENTDGRVVVVVKATAAGSFAVRGLPAGTYGLYYTTSGQTDVRPPDVTVVAGGELSASIPAAGVITIHKR